MTSQNETLASSQGPAPEAFGQYAALQTVVIDKEIAGYTEPWRPAIRMASLRFSAELEQTYESATKVRRVRELQLTLSVASVFYLMTTVTDLAFVPDLGLKGLLLRLVVIPLFLSIIFGSARLSALNRERLVLISSTIAIVLLGVLPALSIAPLAPFAFGSSVLALLYANTTTPLRFQDAWRFSAVCFAAITFLVLTHPLISWALGASMIFQLAAAVSFSLITSYRIEHHMRLNYLLSLRESVRLSSLRVEREALATLSNTDALTGLPNRGYFNRQSAAIFADPTMAGKDAALVMLDVDHFKRFNDHYGHLAGDACLRAVARALSAELDGIKGFAARFGGEEFAIVATSLNPADAHTYADRICKAVAALNLLHANRDDGLHFITASVGVAYGVIGEGSTVDDLIRDADRALYTAKRQGRNRAHFQACLAA